MSQAVLQPQRALPLARVVLLGDGRVDPSNMVYMERLPSAAEFARL